MDRLTCKDTPCARVFVLPTDTMVDIGLRARERWFCGMSNDEIIRTITRWAVQAERAGVRLKAIHG